MADALVLEWMDEYESLTESEIHTYASEQERNHEIMIAIYNALAEPQKYKSDNLVDGVCQQLLNFYRSGEPQLRKFCMQYIPSLVFLHLSDRSYSSVQALLVSLYNLEVIDSKGQPKSISFRIPSVVQASVYHDTNSLDSVFMAENSLRRFEECDTKLVSWGPLPQVECLNAQKRQRVVIPLLVDGICQQLLNFYRSGEPQLRKFCMQYIPSLVFLHLSDRSYSSVQALLVSLYNLEVIDSKGQPKSISFRIPSVVQASVYHDTNSLDSVFMAENSLRRFEECDTKLVSWGPLPQVECLNAQNRQRVVTALVFLYNQQLGNVITQGIELTCKGISRLVTQGFSTTNPLSARSSVTSDSDSNYQPQLPTTHTRIQVSNTLLIELLHTIYFAAERCTNGAIQALHDLIQRASYETYADVLLAANAIKNLLQNSPAGSMAPRPSHTHSISKSMITNASFRTKKLPDDIPIQDDQQPQDAPLDSITEEHEETDKTKSKSASGALKHLQKIPGLSKKHKTKNNPQGDQGADMADGPNDLTPNDGHGTVHVSAV